MARVYANKIWANTYNYNSTAKNYLAIKDEVIAIMREDVKNGRQTTERFEELTGVKYTA